METSTAYQSYLTAMKNYETPEGRKDYQAPFAGGFEAIYNKAKAENVTLSSAKTFLETLSQNEISTLQKYSGLADAVNVGALGSEGAYNLLVHDNEQYDFNNDGVAEVGIGKQILPVPTTMPSDVRDAYITAMNTLNDKDKMMATTLTFDPARLTSTMNGTPYKPTTIDYTFLKGQVENRLNPKDGGFTSEETKASTLALWNAFNASYTGDKTDNTTQERDSGVTQFLKDLHKKGAVKFLSDLNEEKIKKMVDDYKQKLIDKMGNSPKAMQEIEKLVEEFKKKLMEEMKEKMNDESKNKKKVTQVSSNSLVQKLIEMAQKNTTKPLDKLLQS